MKTAEVLRPLLRGDEHFAVTGATGWFGTTALDLLDELLGEDAAARVTAYASRPRDVRTARGRTVQVRALTDLAASTGVVTHLLHFAFLTRDTVASLGVPAFTERNVEITATMVRAIAGLRPRGMLVTSSGAVYDRSGGLAADLTHNAYGTLKHLDELALRQAVTDVGGTPVVARVFNVAGRGMTKPDLYALGSFIRMAQAGGPVQVRARGHVVRSYAGVDEVIALGLWSMLSGEVLVFDSAGHVVEVGELARLVAALHDLPDDAVERSFEQGQPEDRYVGDPAQMAALAQRCGLQLRPMTDLIQETTAGLRADELEAYPRRD